MNSLTTNLNRALHFVGLIGADTSKEKSDEEKVTRLMRALAGVQETPKESEGTIAGWIQSFFKNPGEEEVSLVLKKIVAAQDEYKESFAKLSEKPIDSKFLFDPEVLAAGDKWTEVEKVILQAKLLLMGNRIADGHELSKQLKNLEKESRDLSTKITKMKYEALTGQKLGSKL